MLRFGGRSLNCTAAKSSSFLLSSSSLSLGHHSGLSSSKASSSSCCSNAKRFITSPGMEFLLNPSREHESLRHLMSRFAKEEVQPQAREHDIEGKMNVPLFKRLGELGAFSVTVPEADGGLGMNATAAVIITHELCKYDPGFTMASLAHSLLFVNQFYYSASVEQKKKYLAQTLTGEKIGCMGMTEPGAGTDVLGMKTTATKSSSGTFYTLKGSKIFITNSTVADYFIIYAKANGKITSFLVEKGMKGLSVSKKIDKCGMRSSECAEVYLENVEVSAENVLGKEGGGVTNMMRNLELERICVSAMSVAIAEQCTEYMIQYGKDRKAFGTSINNFGQIQKYIADSFAMTEAAMALTYTISRTIAPGTQNRIGSDAAKLFTAPVGKIVADNAMQVMGGMGYSRDMPVERLWRDAKLSEIGGGTLEAHHKNLTKDLSEL